ncbi:hypothetical protein TMUPMC115_0253 [Tetragenococcus muriaticus PMC-11-5]|uniref:Uncharacterized protein n=1 Tax=Tetragenococcus muriaticus PMC-11-5 TaxID=1302649 RepID=A0A091C9U6_9ENTE|nr:hypothetical protein [Tetragenococcus muriaticus]KFN93655.1 hypothetical protein TMUPMC115_0253 [Tetragenococcus muriaticus PMC-11-5]
MLDLQAIESREIKIKWIDGELVSVNEPTFALFKKFPKQTKLMMRPWVKF